MISVILYGRNDSHGYNLPKRAAISLNCIAEVLSDPDDEILFVDYNTSDDLPTFIEAIYDTLTPKAKSRLRVLRVRPQLHARLVERTHLAALEPHSRNIAIRRSNPRNRWLLFTNTDMIFLPRGGSFRLDRRRSGPPRRTVYSAPIRTARAVVGVLSAERSGGHPAKLAGNSGPRCTWMKSLWRSPPTGSISRAIFNWRRGRRCGTSTVSTNA